MKTADESLWYRGGDLDSPSRSKIVKARLLSKPPTTATFHRSVIVSFEGVSPCQCSVTFVSAVPNKVRVYVRVCVGLSDSTVETAKNSTERRATMMRRPQFVKLKEGSRPSLCLYRSKMQFEDNDLGSPRSFGKSLNAEGTPANIEFHRERGPFQRNKLLSSTKRVHST